MKHYMNYHVSVHTVDAIVTPGCSTSQSLALAADPSKVRLAYRSETGVQQAIHRGKARVWPSGNTYHLLGV